MKNIFITWTSKWIWKFLSMNLENDNNLFKTWWKEKYDLRKKNDIKKISEKISEKNISFDVLILNAWIWEFWSFENNSLEDYEDIINLNLLANIRILKFLEKTINKKTKIMKMLNKW